ncbi:MAG TPA: DUF3876 domain-containing protein [Petrimonas sp.]|uniref:DUF3876 domain-containing protein n=1 Tax=Petrimonas sp. TaxID=2023866 RepID=UPI0017667CBB|nr:DUF3876 domain-containing protein [Petrimonas sp.]
MLKRFSNGQLEKLLLHTVGINSVLTEVLLSEQDESPFEPDPITDVNLDIVVIDPNGMGKRSEKEVLNLDPLCGDWKGGKKKPDMQIFKAAPGYLIALGKKPKNDEVGDCWLIHEFRGNVCFDAGDGVVVISYDKEKDTISLYPGGEYTRMEETKK